MIRQHVDIWAVLFLLVAFALWTNTRDQVLRAVHVSAPYLEDFHSIQVHLPPIQLD